LNRSFRHRGRWALLPLLAAIAGPAQGDVFRPAYLEVRELGQGRYAVMWKVPAQGDRRLGVQVRFPEGTTEIGAPVAVFSEDAYVERWQVLRPDGLAGQVVRVDGISGGVTDVIVRVQRQDGTSQVERLLPERPEFTVQGATSTGEVAWSYLVLGVEHILGGVDHLLFVLALLLIVRGGKRIFATISAFTVAHSITLVAATLGWVHVPGPPVEAIIALSIVFVAGEGVQGLRGRPGLTARAPWVVAFTFGLLHGFRVCRRPGPGRSSPDRDPHCPPDVQRRGRAGAADLRRGALGVRAVFVRLPARWPRWTAYLPPYAIGSVAAYWVIDRLVQFSLTLTGVEWPGHGRLRLVRDGARGGGERGGTPRRLPSLRTRPARLPAVPAATSTPRWPSPARSPTPRFRRTRTRPTSAVLPAPARRAHRRGPARRRACRRRRALRPEGLTPAPRAPPAHLGPSGGGCYRGARSWFAVCSRSRWQRDSSVRRRLAPLIPRGRLPAPPAALQPSGLAQPLPSTRRYVLVWKDQLIPDGYTEAQKDWVVTHYVGSQKLFQRQIDAYRTKNELLLLVYHLAFGLNGADQTSPVGNITGPNTYGREDTDTFTPWVAASGATRENAYQHSATTPPAPATASRIPTLTG
jgi:hypothetical protein